MMIYNRDKFIYIYTVYFHIVQYNFYYKCHVYITFLNSQNIVHIYSPKGLRCNTPAIAHTPKAVSSRFSTDETRSLFQFQNF